TTAGHPSPFRVQRSAGSVESLKTYDPRHGPALGLLEDSTYANCRAPLAVNDLIILFTDGLYEVDSPDHEEFGMDRLLAAVRQRASLSADRLFDELLEETRGFSKKHEFDDD